MNKISTLFSHTNVNFPKIKKHMTKEAHFFSEYTYKMLISQRKKHMTK